MKKQLHKIKIAAENFSRYVNIETMTNYRIWSPKMISSSPLIDLVSEIFLPFHDHRLHAQSGLSECNHLFAGPFPPSLYINLRYGSMTNLSRLAIRTLRVSLYLGARIALPDPPHPPAQIHSIDLAPTVPLHQVYLSRIK